MKNKKPLVSIIIPNYNGERFLKRCFQSLFKSSYRKFEIILIDDGSSDKSIKIIKSLQEKDKRIRLYRNKTNLGASASRNKALKKVKGEVVVFLDNDIEVEKTWLSELLKVLMSSKEIGATCPKMPMLSNRKKISTAGLKLIPHVGWGVALGGRKSVNQFRNRQEDVISISAALAVKKKVIDKIGGFDEKLAVHTEDLDFSWRIWICGWRIVYVPTSIVYHYAKSAEERKRLMGATKSFIYFHINKNTFRILIKNYQLPSLLKYLLWALAITFARGIYVFIKSRDLSAFTTFWKAVYWNIVNLGDTLRERKKVQSKRKFSDTYLYKKIMVHESVPYVFRKYYQ